MPYRMGDLAAEDSYDPFAAEQFVNPAVKAVMGGLAEQVKLPGQMMAPNPYPPGSEEAAFYDASKTQAISNWAPETALTVMGGGVGGTGERAGAALGSGPIRKAPALPMDEASRLARATEQGFDTSRTLYHGTSNEFDAFKPNRGGITYLTDRPDIAEIYANLRKQESGKSYAKDFGREATADPGIMPVYAKAKNPLVISDQGPGGGGWLSDNLATALGVEYKGGANGYRDLLEEARRRGHDQIEVRNMSDLGGDQTQFFMLNPSDIRSKFAAFDPANEGKNMILGSGATDKKGAAAIQGIRAYHSSPHDFDKFDLSKIGTGEGAQVYGHGLYFAENPAVSGQGGQYWNQFIHKFPKEEMRAAELLRQMGFDREAATAELRRQMVDPRMHHTPDSLTRAQAKLDVLESGKPVGPRTYEVNINADPAHFLDWDKAISAQPHVEEALRRGGFVDAKWPYSGMQGELSGTSLQPLTSGEDAYRALGIERMGRNTPTPVMRRAATEALNEAGIPGIKYLDQGSRGAGTGSSNFVVFNPAIIDIMKKYGIAAPIGGMGALAAQDDYQWH